METDISKEKQIRIVTHPFAGNFGGMIQAVALQKVIADNVPDAVCCIGSYKKYSAYSFRYRLKNLLGEIALSFGRRGADLAGRRWLKYKNVRQIYRAITGPRTRVEDFEQLNKTPVDDTRYVVGSDQVWRKLYVLRYAPLSFFFLGSVPEEVRRRSISYAASFGSDEWEGTPEQTEECGKLLRQFRAVSVREDSGIGLCREHFGVEAVQMPDPTLLLQVDEYEKLIATAPVHRNEAPYIATYILDPEPEKSASMQAIAAQQGMALQPLRPSPDAPTRRDRQPLSIPQWLSYMQHADYLLTDSFHGCVFAIIFNKPFVCYGNIERGTTRFETLLKTYGLESRMVSDFSQAAEVLAQPIDWEKVNAVRASERERGIEFLKTNLA